MEEFREFQGKNLDEAIRGACTYFDAPREKLEIEIIQDAKNGIFGLVGARKAVVRARRAALLAGVGNLLGRQAPRRDAVDRGSASAEPAPRAESRRRPEKDAAPRDNAARETAPQQTTHRDTTPKDAAPRDNAPRDSAVRDAEPHRKSCGSAPRSERGTAEGAVRPERTRERAAKHDGNEHLGCESRQSAGERPRTDATPRPERQPRRHPHHPRSEPVASQSPMDREGRGEREGRTDRDTRADRASRPGMESAPRQDLPLKPDFDVETFDAPLDFDPAEGVHDVPFSSLDPEKMLAVTEEAARHLVCGILGDVPISVRLLESRLEVRVESGDDSGLLIGREGQTLAALQYLASRIASRAMNAPVRVQFDVGDYRERQDERLRELALSLAERVRQSGRSCSTRPMSSYHRRIVHMTLQDAEDLQTRSSGDGPLKRVIVQRRKAGTERRGPREV